MLKSRIHRVRPERFVAGEVVILLGLFLVYKYARLLIPHPDHVAFDHAERVLDLERLLRLPNELHVQDVLLSSDLVVQSANAYYAYVHFPLTGLFLVWLVVRSREHYLRLRTVLILTTGAALAIHTAFPLAPPRMFGDLGFVDTASAYGQSVYHAAPQSDGLANQFAAMPSLHFGWAVVVALGVIRASGSPRRWLWILHPVITLVVIVGTANHFWLDAVVAGVLILVADHAVRRWAPVARLARPMGPGVYKPAVLTPGSRGDRGPERPATPVIGVSGGGVRSRVASRSPQPRSSSRAPAP